MSGQTSPTSFADDRDELPLTPEEEAEVRRILDSLDARLTEAEQRMDRVLAQLRMSRVA